MSEEKARLEGVKINYEQMLHLTMMFADELDHLGREFYAKGKQREARAIMFAVEHILNPRLKDFSKEIEYVNDNIQHPKL